MIECARCGYKNDAAAKFCAACGAPMATPAGFSPAAAQPPAPAWGQAIPQPAPAPQWGPAPNLQAPPAHQAPQVPQAPPNAQAPNPLNLPPPQWGMPAPPAFIPQQPAWGAPAPQVQVPSTPAQPFPVPQAAVAPGWGYPGPMPTPEGVHARAPVQEAPGPVVVPTTASAVMAPLEPEQIPPNAPRTLAGFLVNFDANPLGQYWVVYQGQNLVGRRGSGVELHLEIDHPTTSSRHATIHAAARPGRLKVEDLGSTNGTYVNERRLEPGERRLLQSGDTLRFGGFSVTVIAV